jgi:cell division protein FtsL
MTRSNPIRHTFNPARWRPQRQAIALTTLALFVGIIMGALYLSQAATAATLGRELERLIVQRQTIEQQNEELRAEIASLRSVPHLQNRARELGFQPITADRLEYIVIAGYVPRMDTIDRTVAVAPAAPQIAPAPVYDETFTGWLQAQFDAFTRQLSQFTEGS